MKEVYIAVDYGGGSGRVIAGSFRQGQLELETISRFGNRQVRMGGHTYWDFLSLFQDMKEGLRMAVRIGYKIKSIGIDTWGVDFGFIDKQGNLLGNPICYRDQFTNGLPEELSGSPHLDLRTIRWTLREAENGYSCRIAIPWKTIGCDGPSEIGFDIIADDTENSRRIACHAWAGNDENYRNRFQFGRLLLTPNPGN